MCVPAFHPTWLHINTAITMTSKIDIHPKWMHVENWSNRSTSVDTKLITLPSSLRVVGIAHVSIDSIVGCNQPLEVADWGAVTLLYTRWGSQYRHHQRPLRDNTHHKITSLHSVPDPIRCSVDPETIKSLSCTSPVNPVRTFQPSRIVWK